jgi:elongation factor P
MKVSANSLKKGNVIVYDKRLWTIAKDPEHVKPGKGGAFIQLEMKDLKTSTKLNHRFRSTEDLERAYLEQKDMQFLYAEGDNLIFMDQSTFDQVEVSKTAIDEDMLPFLQESMLVTIEFFEGAAINFTLPETVVLEICETDPVIKGSTATASAKSAKLSNGVVIKVPQYLTSGEKIVVKTADRSFVERVK